MSSNIMRHWSDERGSYDGGIACGEGFVIAWRRGDPMSRYGATVEDVLSAVLNRLESGRVCHEGQGLAAERVAMAIEAIRGRE